MTSLNIQRALSLKAFNSLAVECEAEYFVVINNELQLIEAIDYAKQLRLPITVLGGGSNVVLADELKGLVIQLAIKGIKATEKNDEVFITAKAGENWHELVTYCVANHYHGIENLALIPGNVGAAAIQNIGAYGVELQDVMHTLKGLDCSTGQWRTLSRAECELSYRDSVFKQGLKDRFIITELTLQLTKTYQPNIAYKALSNLLKADEANTTQPSAEQVSQAVIAIRSSKLPQPSKLPNAGSFFKNPIIKKSQFDELIRLFPEIVFYPGPSNTVKLAAGWLIEQLGWKGKQINGVAMHENQALVLINHSGSGGDVLSYAKLVQDSVMQRFGVKLDIEPRVYF